MDRKTFLQSCSLLPLAMLVSRQATARLATTSRTVLTNYGQEALQATVPTFESLDQAVDYVGEREALRMLNQSVTVRAQASARAAHWRVKDANLA